MPHVDELTVLLPVDISAEEPPSLDIVDLLGPSRVVLLGYFPVPKQAEPALIKDEYEADAEAKLLDIARGRPDLTEVLVFTHDREATVARVAEEYGCDAVLTPGEVAGLDRVLVPIRGDANLERIVSVVAGLLDVSDASATFFHSVGEDVDPSGGEFLLRGAAERLTEYGIDDARVDWRLSQEDDPQAAIDELGREYDVVVVGETEPSLRDRVFGDVLTRVVDAGEYSTLVVRDAR